MPRRIVILGGGVAAVESVLALRQLAGPLVQLTLVSPDDGFRFDALQTSEAFGLSTPKVYSLTALAATQGATYLRDVATTVDAEDKVVHLASGASVPWDDLVVAIGACPVAALEHCDTAFSARLPDIVARLRDDLVTDRFGSAMFLVPPGVFWTMPAYELALMTRREADRAGRVRFAITIVSTESAPLGMFGAAASQEVHDLLDREGIAFVADAYATTHRGGRVSIRPHRRVLRAERLIALPRPEGPFLTGLPHDTEGFLPTDQHGRVRGVDGVYAAGACTDFPIRQGGLATQQADALASCIPAQLGPAVACKPFRPVLRGRLVTGGNNAFMHHQMAGGAGEGRHSLDSLWSPPSKVNGRFISAWLYHEPRRPEPSHRWRRAAAPHQPEPNLRRPVGAAP